jgi:hypothetical protein
MGVDRTGAGTDQPAEAVEEPPPADRRPPPDRPGAEGAPSRADSRNGAAAANETSTQAAEKQGEDKPDTDQREQAPDGQTTPHDSTSTDETDRHPVPAGGTERTEDRGAGETTTTDANDSADAPAPSAVDIGDRPDSAPRQAEDALVSAPDTQELPPDSLDASPDVAGDVGREPADDAAEAAAPPQGEGRPESTDKPQPDPPDRPLPAADTSTGAEQGGEIETTEPAPPAPDNASRAADTTEQPLLVGEHGPDVSGEIRHSIDRQRAVGKELAEVAEQKVDREIDQTLDKVNPQFDRTKSAYSENCTGVVQANELRRRGSEVEAGPLEKHLRTDEGGPGGRLLEVIQKPWDRSFTPGTKAEIEEAFKQPGSRGVVFIAWSGPGGGGHVFNVENVGGKVRFVDGQPTPPVSDASHYFNVGHDTRYVRLDDRATPPESATKPYLES